MSKKYFLFILFMIAFVPANQLLAQSIIKAEYYVDIDPGVGNATTLSILPGDTTIAAFSLPALFPPGNHNLFVRVQDNQNNWSMSMHSAFFVLPEADTQVQLSAAEYFLDSDPGLGNGTAIPISALDTSTQSFNLTIPLNLSVGHHLIGIRTKDTGGVWSMFEYKSFYVLPKLELQNEIVSGEYFIDNDPGAGNGYFFQLANLDTINTNLNITVPAAISVGQHSIHFRVKDTNKKWSHFATKAITIKEAAQHLAGSGKAIHLDGIDDYVQLPPIINGANQFTVDFWIKTSENGSNASFWQKPTILGNANPSAPDGDFGITTNNGMLGVWSGICPCGDQDLQTSKSINDNKWHHIAAVNNGTNLVLYVDGLLLPGSIPTNGGTIQNNDRPWRVGANNSCCSGGSPHEGTVDELRFWNIPLSELQIRDRMCSKIHFDDTLQFAAGLPSFYENDSLYSNLVAKYNCDETNASYLIDDGNTGLSATMHNGADRIKSGAPIGDQSMQVYPSQNTMSNYVFFGNAQTHELHAELSTENVKGFHIYHVNEKASDTIGLPPYYINQVAKGYFGIFPIGAIDTINLKYFHGYFQALKLSERVFARNNNADSSWNLINSSRSAPNFLSTFINTGTQNEYALGNIPINLDSVLLPGQISQNQTICLGNNAVIFNSDTNAISLLGDPINYQWQDSIAGGLWNNINGAVGSTYLPIINETTYPTSPAVIYFRRKAANSVGTLNSNVVQVTVNYPSDTNTIQINACNIANLPFGITVDSSGIYHNTYSNTLGCDSVVAYEVTIHENSTGNSNLVACNSISIAGVNGDNPIIASGAYSVNLLSQWGCDSIHIYNISIINISASINYNTSLHELTIAASGGTAPYTYQLNNFTPQNVSAFNVIAPGTYTISVFDANNCSFTSTYTLNSPTFTTTHSATKIRCYGYTSEVEIHPTGGTEPFMFSVDGINFSTDSIFNLSAGSYTVTVYDALNNISTNSFVLLQPDSIDINVAVMHLLCNGDSSASINAEASGGTTFTTLYPGYTWASNYQYDWYDANNNHLLNDSFISNLSAGTYYLVVEDAEACIDTIYNISITEPPILSGSSLHEACDSFTIDNQQYTASGSHTSMYTNSNGCDSSHTYIVSIKYSSTASSNHTACDSITLPSGAHTQSGTYTATFTNAAGCDSIHSYNITIKHSSTASSNHTACDSITLPSGTHTQSGTYTATFTNAAGCDSIHTYNVTIKYSSTAASIHTACDSITLPSGTHTQSGIYTATFTNAAGCDSIHTYIVTIKYSSTASSIHTACDSITLPSGTHTQSGIYTATFTNAAGCDSVHSYNVTIKYSSAAASNHTACNSITLPSGTHTQSGIYTATFTNAAGCDSIHTYNVTIKYSSTAASNHTACDSITLPSGTHTQSGIYTATLTNAAGCDSVHTYNVTINHSYSNVFSDTAILSYLLPWSTVPISSSGIYSHVYQTIYGCDSVVSVHLTITGIKLQAKVFLSGPYNANTGLMSDQLRSLGLVPTADPYLNAPYNAVFIHEGGGTIATTTSSILNTTGNNAIVDWVFIQLRDKYDDKNVLFTRSALVQRDGDVVDASDGVSPVLFANAIPDQYYISIKHRNHLGVMTLNKYMLSGSPTVIDFSSLSTPLYLRPSPSNNPSPLSGPTRVFGSTRALYAGNCLLDNPVNNARFISYNSFASSDRTALVNATGGSGTINGYSVYDVDMNGYARFNGLNPDRLIILQNTAGSNIITTNEQTPN